MFAKILRQVIITANIRYWTRAKVIKAWKA